MAARLWTDAEEVEIAKIYLVGHSARAIARAYGIKNQHYPITAALRRQGVELRTARKWTDEKEVEIADLYTTQKRTIKSISEDYKIHHSSVRQILIRQGVKITVRPRKFTECNLTYPDQEIENIRHLYQNEKVPLVEIAENYDDMSYEKLLKVIDRAGIERHNASRKYTVDECVFDEFDEETAYWLGFIYADGCVHRSYLQVALAVKDKHHLEKLSKFMQSNKSIYEKRQEEIVAAVFFGLHLTNRLRELGILPRRPKLGLCIDRVPPEFHHHWLRGFFDGDGSAGKKNRTIHFGSSRRELMVWIRDFLAVNADRNPNLKITTHKTKYSSSFYSMSYGKAPNARKVAECMYKDATIWLERKRDIIDGWPEPLSRSEQVKKGWITRRKNQQKKERAD